MKLLSLLISLLALPVLAQTAYWTTNEAGQAVLYVGGLEGTNTWRVFGFRGSVTNQVQVAGADSITNGLVLYWSLDDYSAITDLSGNDHTGTSSGMTNVAGLLGNAVRGNSLDMVSAVDSPLLSASDGNSLTIVVWAYASAGTLSANQALVAKRTDSTHAEYELWHYGAGGALGLVCYTNSGSTSAASVSAAGEGLGTGWKMFTAQIDATNKICRVRSGTNDWTTSDTFNGWGASGTGIDTTGIFKIGNFAAASLYANVDELGVWRRLLTDEEIATLYNHGAGLTYPFE